MAKNAMTKIYSVDLGFDIEDEINATLKEKVNPATIADADDILNELAETPSVKRAKEKNELMSRVQSVIDMLNSQEEVNKEIITETIGKNTNSCVQLIKNHLLRTTKQKLVKTKNGYSLNNRLDQTED